LLKVAFLSFLLENKYKFYAKKLESPERIKFKKKKETKEKKRAGKGEGKTNG
jgi:hypothetical protein